MRYRSRIVAALTAALLALPAAAPPNGRVIATVTGLRSHKGQLLACLTARADAFPHCEKDPEARRLIRPASLDSIQLDFGPVPPGRYAIAVVHDENGNGQLDTRLMIPREGYGFSRDAPVRMGPPRFDRAAFEVAAYDQRLSVTIRYIF